MSRNTLIFVPGLLCTGELFSPQMEELGRRYDVAVADTLSDVTIDAMARRLLAAAPERFSLAGLSMGGYVALAAARLAPERIEKLALMDTSARADTEEQTANRRRLIELAQRDSLRAAVRLLTDKLLAPANRSDVRLAALVEGMADEVGLEGFVIQQEAIIGREDSRPHLPSIRCRTLVLVGEEDAITPVNLARELADGLADATLATIPGAGHLTTLEAPEKTTAALAEFLERD